MAVESEIVGATEVTEDDFLEAFGHVPAFQRAQRRFLMLPVFAVALLAANRVFATQDEPWLDPAVLLRAVPTVGLPLLLAVWLRRRTPREWARGAKNNGALGAVDYRLAEGGLHVRQPLRQVDVGWMALAGYRQSPQSFLIYTGPRMILVIPKRAFGARAAEVEQLLHRKLLPHREPQTWRKPVVLWLVLVVFLIVWHSLNGGVGAR